MTSLESFIDTLHRVHLDNSRQYYSAAQWSGSRSSTPQAIMPATPFVFEFFIYNSIYQIDWEESSKSGNRVEHPVTQDEEGNTSRMSEGKQQSRLERFLKQRCDNPLFPFLMRGDGGILTKGEKANS